MPVIEAKALNTPYKNSLLKVKVKELHKVKIAQKRIDQPVRIKENAWMLIQQPLC